MNELNELNESLNKVGKSQSKLSKTVETQEILSKKLLLLVTLYCLALIGVVALFLAVV